ncbi:hypothetical protein [Salana multivorans]
MVEEFPCCKCCERDPHHPDFHTIDCPTCDVREFTPRELIAHDREVAARALREYADGLNLHKVVPNDDSLAYLCEDDECLWWDMTYAEQDRIRERADRIEKGENRG